MRRVTTLLLTATILSSCGVSTEQVATFTPQALYVDASEGGFGPVAATGPLPGWGSIDLWGWAGTDRYRGDINTGSGHVGRTIAVDPDETGYWWAQTSPQFTSALACASPATGPSTNPCAGQSPAPISITPSGTYLPWPPVAIVVGYTPNCPATPGMTTVHQCTGIYTPYDGSTIATAVVTDGLPKPGLPFGTPLKLTPAADPAGQQVECVVDLSTYGIQGQFVRPPGYTLGNSVVAVYSCP